MRWGVAAGAWLHSCALCFCCICPRASPGCYGVGGIARQVRLPLGMCRISAVLVGWASPYTNLRSSVPPISTHMRTLLQGL